MWRNSSGDTAGEIPKSTAKRGESRPAGDILFRAAANMTRSSQSRGAEHRRNDRERPSPSVALGEVIAPLLWSMSDGGDVFGDRWRLAAVQRLRPNGRRPAGEGLPQAEFSASDDLLPVAAL